MTATRIEIYTNPGTAQQRLVQLGAREHQASTRSRKVYYTRSGAWLVAAGDGRGGYKFEFYSTCPCG